jgi:hypothetical protein
MKARASSASGDVRGKSSMRRTPGRSGAGRTWLAAVALVSLVGVGARCRPQPFLYIVSPLDGASITSCTVQVGVETKGTADPATLDATLNGNPLVLAHVGGTLYSADVSAADLAAGANSLVVSVTSLDGLQMQTVTSDFQFAADEPRARRITDPDDLITGPLGHSRLGDWLLENCTARFVVQDAPQRDLHSVGQYGGNLIDAERVGRPGRDQFFEVQPALNVETVVNAQSVEIVNDGLNGQPAIVRTCGPDDLVDYINPSTVAEDLGFTFPPAANDFDQNVDACTEYTLEAGKPYVKVETIVTNHDPTSLGMYVGDYVNGMGSLEQWTPSTAAVGEIAVTNVPAGVIGADMQTYFSFGADAGVDYSLIPVEFPSPYGTSSFSTSGVTFVAQSHAIIVILAFGFAPTFVVPGNGQNSYVRYFGVGDGSPSNGADILNEVQGYDVGTVTGCVTVGGAPAPGARVAVGPRSGGTTGPITLLATLFVTGDDGCYGGTMYPGDWGVAASLEGTPYQGGGSVPAVQNVTVVDGQNTVVPTLALPSTGRVQVSVVDENGLAVPARVSVVGFDPSPEPRLFTTALSANDVTTGLFRDVTKDPIPFGLTWIAYTEADGTASFDLEPGSYQLFVSRGTEYSAYDTAITVSAGSITPVAAQIARVIDTPGFISSDYHVHMLNSPDSRISLANRARSFAGESVDNIIATDHDAHTDLTPTIGALGLTPFVHATIGEEITSFDYGHFNGYPQAIDPNRVSAGSTDWAGAAPAGQDFPSHGSYTLTPGEIEAAAVNAPLNAGLGTTVQINHISSHFSPLKIDTSLPTGPASLLTDAEKQKFRFCSTSIAGSCAARGEIFHAFAAVELWNGADAGAQNTFLRERIGIWMNLLNQGIPTTFIADTDTHTFNDLEQAGARTWTPSSGDAPPDVVDQEIGLAVNAGKAVGGQGVYVQTRLLATDGSGGTADFTLGGATLVPVTNGEVDVEIDVQAPLWAEYDRIEIYRNAQTCIAARNGGVPVLFGAVPTLTLTAGGTDTGSTFTIAQVNDFPGIPGAGHRESHRTVRLSGLAGDAWVAVVVKGTSGVSRPMFPIYPRSLSTASNTTLAALLDGNLGQGGVLALGATNALYVDVDGNGFDAPGVPPPLDPCP